MALTQTAVTGFPLYGKIDTLFERQEDFTVDSTRLKKSVIGTITEWDVDEKIDGTNIRVMMAEDGSIAFGGRSDNAQMPTDLLQKLMRMFTLDVMRQAFPTPVNVVLFGEGYGPGIQKGGGLYRADKSFILFDVLVDGKWWLDHDAVIDVATKLGIDAVPYLGRMALTQIVDLVKQPFLSKLGTAVAEGVVARPIETLFDKRGERLIIKLKTRDFQAGKR